LGRWLFRDSSPRKKIWLTFAGVIIIAVFTGLISYPRAPSWVPGSGWFNKFNIQLGLDLKGGSHLVYQADVSQVPPAERADSLNGVRDVIERRINFFGVAEPVIQTNKVGDNWRVIVELPGVKDVNQAIKLIGETPILEFKEQSAAPPDNTDIIKFNNDAKKTADDILAQAKSGQDFTQLARQFSEDEGSKVQGGDLNWFAKGVMVQPFEDAVFGIKVGDIYPTVVESQFGYHIIKKTGERQNQDSPEARASHILIKTKAVTAGETQWVATNLSGKDLKKAQVQFDQQTGLPEVNLTFNDAGKKLFGEITARNVGKPVAIFLDGAPISTPTVQQAITGGEAVITGNFNLTEAKQLAQRLNSGALPVPISLLSQQTIAPSLGQASVDKSLLAGLFGLVLVAVFMVVYYRLPGVLAVVALGIYLLITLAIFKLWPITLTLAGIAGYILSVGMAVDANVLIFERMKEELKLGKSLHQAIEEGFKRAWTSIRDSNVSSLITAVILMWLGSSLVKGFAVTLGLGILVSMFSAIIITRTLLRLVATGRMANWRWPFGVSKKKIISV